MRYSIRREVSSIVQRATTEPAFEASALFALAEAAAVIFFLAMAKRGGYL
jgi:hypothetical protein